MSNLILGIFSSGKTIAVLEAVNKPVTEGGVFTPEDATLLTSLVCLRQRSSLSEPCTVNQAATAASVLRQAQLYDEAVASN